MYIKPIRSEQDYLNVLERIDALFDAQPDTIEGDELEVLAVLVENYERERFPIDLPDPIEAILFRMEQAGFKQKDLAALLGLKSRASEILNRQRLLSLPMIRRLNEEWNIPTKILVKKYSRQAGKQPAAPAKLVRRRSS